MTRTFDYFGFFVMYDRQIHNGALCFEAVHHETDQRVKRQFYGYSVTEAKYCFKQQIKQLIRGQK